jgi:catechol 2,3-dioxygenase-like lactoylglutathione lyase family enzyme
VCAKHMLEAGSLPAGLTDSCFDHIGLSVADLDAAVHFYQHGFSLREEVRFAVEAHAMTAVILRSPQGWAIELLHRPDSARAGCARPDPDSAVLDRGYGHFCLRVDDIDAVFGRLLGLGATEVVAPRVSPHPAIRFSYVADPEGNLVELINVPAGVAL